MEVKIENLYYAYADTAVLKGINLTAHEKEMLCIAGPNGGGKSTLVKCIDALLTPKAGRVLLDGVDVRSLSRAELARKIGYVPQSGSELFPTTVFETVMMGRKARYRWSARDSDIDIVLKILQMMELDTVAMKDFAALSGGQKQRVLPQKPCVITREKGY